MTKNSLEAELDLIQTQIRGQKDKQTEMIRKFQQLTEPSNVDMILQKHGTASAFLMTGKESPKKQKLTIESMQSPLRPEHLPSVVNSQ